MVAYNFKGMFAEDVRAGRKRSTIRPPRALRHPHASPGDHLQLYVGMRTKACEKLVEPDPVCIGAADIVIEVPRDGDLTVPGAIMVDGLEVWGDGLEHLVRTDGFATPLEMGKFWLATHGAGTFEGKLITW